MVTEVGDPGGPPSPAAEMITKNLLLTRYTAEKSKWGGRRRGDR